MILVRWRRALLLRLFHLLYHPLAGLYDAVSWLVSLGRWQRWGETALDFAVGPRVLELGHGPGHLLASLGRGGWWAVGIDLSPQMGALARRRLVARGLAARLARGRGQALPFVDGSFHSVIAAFPAPYILEPEAAAELWRVLRPGGRLVIVPEAELTGGGLPGRAVEWLYRVTGQRGAPGGDNAERDVMWNRPLGAAGFEVSVNRVRQAESIITVVVAEKAGRTPGS